MALVLGSTAEAKRPAACPDGRFLLPAGAGLLAPPAAGDRQVVSLAGRQLAIDGLCEPRKAKIKASRRATVVGARWRSCGDLENVRLSAKIAAPACGVLRGSLKAKKRRPIAFEAGRSACGDGFADRAAGETCDVPPGDGGGGGGGGGTGSEPTLASLDAARDALAAGATDVALSPDGSLRFRRAATPTGGIDTIVRGGTTLVRWVHDGDVTAMTSDDDGDGVPELAIDARRAPARAAVVRYDLDGDGSVEQTVSMTQVGADGVQVEITEAGKAPVGFTTTLLQEARGDAGPRPIGGLPAASVTTEGCTADQEAAVKASLSAAMATGIKCLRDLGLDSIAKVLEGKVARDGVKLRCGGTTDCAQIDILDSVTRGAVPTAVGITLGNDFLNGSGLCSNGALIIFHELLHLGFGAAHSPFLDRTKFEGLATDSVYSCADLCFRPTQATKSQCAKCLQVDRCDAKCSAYADGSEGPCDLFVDIESLACPTTSCQCCKDCPAGVRWQETIRGRAGGPEGTILRTNLQAIPDGELMCTTWTQVACPGTPGGVTQCCRRDPGQPSETAFVGSNRQPPSIFPIDCFCPVPPPPVGVEIVAQVVTSTGGAEDTVPVTCP